MKLEDTGAGIAKDWRDAVSLRTSATVGAGRTLERATSIALISLIRTADERYLQVDATTVETTVKTMGGRKLIIATAIAYEVRINNPDQGLTIRD